MARSILLTAIAALIASAAPQAGPEPVRLSLQEASERRLPDFSPVHEGKKVEVSGLMGAPPIQQMLDYSLLGIQDAVGRGLFISGPREIFQNLAPGTHLRVTGTLSKRGGVPVVVPGSLEAVERGSPPVAIHVRPGELRSFTHLGMLVETEGIVTTSSENSGGEILQIGQEPDSIRIFLPRLHARADLPLRRFVVGDKIRVTGVSSQYCPLPPHDRFFQVLISDPNSLVLLAPRNLLPPELVSGAVTLAVSVLAIWWIRERRLSSQHRQMRILNGLSEDILAASSVTEILRKLRTELTAAFDISGVELYLFHYGSSSLELVQPQGVSPAAPIPVTAPSDAPDSPIAVCFRNRTILKVPDTRRSPFFPEPRLGQPRSVVFFPMIAQNEVLGVLEMFAADRRLSVSLDEQAGAQHVANQVGAALRLLEQQNVREQLFRSERLAASGQLITGVAGQLREPLATIATRVSGLLEHCEQPEHQRELLTIASEARLAAGIVARLVSFARADKAQARPVDLERLLEGLVEFRNRECRARGISISAEFSGDPLVVLGSEDQLEHVFLSLLVHAGQQVAGEKNRSISVSGRRLGGQALVEISFTEGTASQATEESNGADGLSLGLDLCRGVIQTHGGAIRMTIPAAGLTRVEVELPLYEARLPAEVRGVHRPPGRLLTTLVIDSDVASRRDLVAALASRGHRAVPVGSAEEAVDLIDRIKFDAVFCAARLPGLNWVEFFERSRRRIGTFVLLTEGYDAELARAFPGGEGLLLSKPIEEQSLDAVLAGTENAAPLRRL